MIFGPNFGGPPIPDGEPRSAWRKFKRRLRIDGERYLLVGVAQDRDELDRMLMAATNGRRRLHAIPVTTAGGVWYGVYAN